MKGKWEEGEWASKPEERRKRESVTDVKAEENPKEEEEDAAAQAVEADKLIDLLEKTMEDDGNAVGGGGGADSDEEEVDCSDSLSINNALGLLWFPTDVREIGPGGGEGPVGGRGRKGGGHEGQGGGGRRRELYAALARVLGFSRGSRRLVLLPASEGECGREREEAQARCPVSGGGLEEVEPAGDAGADAGTGGGGKGVRGNELTDRIKLSISIYPFPN